VGIRRSVTSAVADPESHAHYTFVDFFTHAFDLSHTVQIFDSPFSAIHVNHAINRCWRRALVTIEGEIPPPAAGMTVIETKNTIPKDAQTSFVRRFVENTFLQRLINHHQQLLNDIET